MIDGGELHKTQTQSSSTRCHIWIPSSHGYFQLSSDFSRASKIEYSIVIGIDFTVVNVHARRDEILMKGIIDRVFLGRATKSKDPETDEKENIEAKSFKTSVKDGGCR